MSAEDIDKAFDLFLKGEFRTDTASEFPQKIKATCASMGHTGAASTEARRKSLAMMSQFGIPSSMLAVSPRDDNVVFSEMATANNKDDHSFEITLSTKCEAKEI